MELAPDQVTADLGDKEGKIGDDVILHYMPKTTMKILICKPPKHQ